MYVIAHVSERVGFVFDLDEISDYKHADSASSVSRTVWRFWIYFFRLRFYLHTRVYVYTVVRGSNRLKYHKDKSSETACVHRVWDNRSNEIPRVFIVLELTGLYPLRFERNVRIGTIIYVNSSGTNARENSFFFTLLASWGFYVLINPNYIQNSVRIRFRWHAITMCGIHIMRYVCLRFQSSQWPWGT